MDGQKKPKKQKKTQEATDEPVLVAPSSSLSSSVTSSAGLASIFSTSSITKFARSQKADEIVPEKRAPKLDAAATEQERLKQEKRKAKRAKRYDALEKAEQTALSRGSATSAAANGVASGGAPAPTTGSDSAASSSSSNVSVDRRSVFIGNAPLASNMAKCVSSMKALCAKYGAVETLRIRSLPIEGTAVDEPGNQSLVRRVCAQQGKLGTQKSAMNCYVVFSNEESVALALADNNMLVGEGTGNARHIRIDRAVPTAFPPALTVFLGGLPLYADEEEVREYFAAALPNGHDDIRGIRIVRDPESMVGKGIGYLHLNDRDGVMAALSLHQGTYKKRWQLRVTPCAKRTKTSFTGADGVLVKKRKAVESGGQAGAGAEGEDPSLAANGEAGAEGGGGVADGEKARRKKDKGEARPGAARRVLGKHQHKQSTGPNLHKGKMVFKAAGGSGVGKAFGNGSKGNADSTRPKLINLKNTMTRKKVLQDRGQVKKDKGRKGKRLGGNVKKAMKVAKGKAI